MAPFARLGNEPIDSKWSFLKGICRNPCGKPDLRFHIQTCRPKKPATIMTTTTTPMM